ncbi:MAG: serine/threonine protein kinase [Deltaproteobacteria bacterium]|nr:serine/threonine protein kinase [Deltaproteobacteria bacterium]
MGSNLEMTQPAEGTPPRSVPPGMVGRQLDHYVLQEELGQGGMSVVYRARDQVLQRDVAIKVLHPFLADRPDARRRLAREARAVAKLRHANILEVYGFSGEDAPQGYIAMEMVRGETLKAFGEREKFYPSEVAAAVAWVVAGALQHAHENGVVHRDVKPENVMIRQDGALKLMDFGIAHVVDAANLTITGTLQGSPAHMAPEVIEGLDVDARADLFSLGTVLFWLATAQLPFTAKSPHALLKRIVEGRYTEPQRLNPEIPDRLAAVIRRLLARDPADRFMSAADLRDALQAVWEEGGLEDPAVSLPLFFKAPDRCRTEWAERAANRFATTADQHLAAGDRVKALSAVNRVLALRPEHPSAAGLMRRLEQRSRTAGRIRIVLGFAAVLGVAGSAVGVTRLVDEQVAADAPAPVDPATVAAPAAPPSQAKAAAPAPRRPSAPGLRGGGRPERVAKPAAPLVAQPLAPPAQLAAALPVARRHVVVRADPWADLEVDGEVVGRGKKAYELDLPDGNHKLRFLHTYAQTEERELPLGPEGPLELSVTLHRAKPAHVVIQCPDNPDVELNGVYKGTASESARTPILVPLPELQWRMPVTITLQRKGKETMTFERYVVAGETTDVPVSMRDAVVSTEREVLRGEDEEPAPR